MKITIEYDNEDEAKMAMNAWQYKDGIDQIWHFVFRPSRKHGYGDELLDSEPAREIIEKLIERYHESVEHLDLR